VPQRLRERCGHLRAAQAMPTREPPML
jgi:hypothetical protein